MYLARSLQDAKRLTPGYTSFFREDGALADMREHYHPGWVSHGVVVATAGELARFVQALFGGQLLSAQMVEQMVEPVIVPATHPHMGQPAYGLGFMLDAQPARGLVAGHGGGGPGYATAAFYFSDSAQRDVVVVALVNCDRGNLGMEIVFVLNTLLAKLGQNQLPFS